VLVEFRVCNYGCFRDEQVLSMMAGSDKSLPGNVISAGDGKLRLLRSAVIYGANASGKTTLLRALEFATSFVIGFEEAGPLADIDVTPFVLDPESASGPSQFELTFIQNDVRYQYGFTTSRRRVTHEYMFATPRGRTVPYFERRWNPQTEQDEYTFGPSLLGQNEIVRELTRPNALYLTMAALVNHRTLTAPYTWFGRRRYRGNSPSLVRAVRAYLIRDDPEVHQRLRALLNYADLGIEDYRVIRNGMVEGAGTLSIPSETRALRETPIHTFALGEPRFEMLHPASDNKLVPLPFEAESKGTQHLFLLGSALLETLAEGGCLLVDELDASMHPLLVRAVIELFHDPTTNVHDAQLIFNTHDTTLLDNDLFRRDQVWFCEKDPSGAAHVYSLWDFSPRRDESLGKGYLQGRYGALPFVGDTMSLSESIAQDSNV
jgi:uncharacterized protein